jgi:hypothetical protein
MDRDYKYNWDEMIRWFFILMNDGMAMKRRGGTKSKTLGRMLDVF